MFLGSQEISNVSGLVYLGQGGGGSSAPTFTETKLVDNSSLASSFTFSQDYHNFDFVKIVFKDTANDVFYTTVITPALIDRLYTLTPVCCLNRPGTNIYVCYSQSSLTWTRTAQRTCDVYEIYGIDCDNYTVQEDILYEAQSLSNSSVPVTSQNDLTEYDYIFTMNNTTGYDELIFNCFNFRPNGLGDEYSFMQVYNGYGAFIRLVDNYTLPSAAYAFASAVKFV